MKKIIFLFILITVLSLSSCRSSKSSVSTVSNWTEAVIPFKLNIGGTASLSASGKAYLAKNESTYLSIRFLGIEMFSLYANNDSVWIYDKTSGTLLEGPLGHLQGHRKKLNQQEIQKILFGVGEYGKSIDLSIDQCNISLKSSNYMATPLGLSASEWTGEAILPRQELDATANLNWDFSKSDWNPDHLPEWKKPSKPKKILGTSDFINLLMNSL